MQLSLFTAESDEDGRDKQHTSLQYWTLQYGVTESCRIADYRDFESKYMLVGHARLSKKNESG